MSGRVILRHCSSARLLHWAAVLGRGLTAATASNDIPGGELHAMSSQEERRRVILFSVALPIIFFVFGVCSVVLAARSWRGNVSPPSDSLLFMSASVRLRGFVDRCALPFGLLYACLGVALGTARPAADSATPNTFLGACFSSRRPVRSSSQCSPSVCIDSAGRASWYRFTRGGLRKAGLF